MRREKKQTVHFDNKQNESRHERAAYMALGWTRLDNDVVGTSENAQLHRRDETRRDETRRDETAGGSLDS